MATTNQARVGKAMELLRSGLAHFVSREFITHYQGGTVAELERLLNTQISDRSKPFNDLDVAALLKVLEYSWNDVYRDFLGRTERSIVFELRDIRNAWAHQQTFSTDDAYRALDSTHRLLMAVSSPQAGDLDKMKTELLRVRFDEQARTQRRRTATSAAESQIAGGLPPWREVVTPHQDVATGRYQQAEFRCGPLAGPHRRGRAGIPRPHRVLPPHLPDRQPDATTGWRHPTARRRRWRPGDPAPDQLRWRQDPLHAGALPPLLRHHPSESSQALRQSCRRPASRACPR